MRKGKFLLLLFATSMLACMFMGCEGPVKDEVITKPETLEALANEESTPATDTVPEAKSGDIYVNTVEALVAALDSDITIHLMPGVYNITDTLTAPVISGDALYSYKDQYIGSDTVYDGYEFLLMNLKNVKIVCDDPVESAEIVASPRYACVLKFIRCENITLSNVTIGHTVEPGYCTGAVLHFDDCKDISLNALDLYGCGTYGIEAYNSEGIYGNKLYIHDCSEGLVNFQTCKNAVFDRSTFTYKEGYGQICAVSSQLSFYDCTFVDIESYTDFDSWDEDSVITFMGCTISSCAVSDIHYFEAKNVYIMD